MKTVLITGSSSGIGLSTCKAFVSRGWRVIATLRRAEERRALIEGEVGANLENFIVKQLDISDENDVRLTTDFIQNEIGGRLDCLVNNAGTMILGPSSQMSREQVASQIDVNLTSTINLTNSLTPSLVKANGQIINISSVFGFSSWPLTSVYSAYKFGINGWSTGLRQELAPYGVDVSLVEPGSHSSNLVKSSEWATGSSELFAEDMRLYKGFRSAQIDNPGASPSRVADKILNIAESSRPRLHNTVGIDARLSFVMSRLFPELANGRLMGNLARKIWSRAKS